MLYSWDLDVFLICERSIFHFLSIFHITFNCFMVLMRNFKKIFFNIQVKFIVFLSLTCNLLYRSTMQTFWLINFVYLKCSSRKRYLRCNLILSDGFDVILLRFICTEQIFELFLSEEFRLRLGFLIALIKKEHFYSIKNVY